MSDTTTNLPPVVDRSAFQAELDRLRVRRRRLPRVAAGRSDDLVQP
ncbi:hypothetical protein [Cryptosporangium aurantiacum]|uniref:Uncharacterized protein n=1 Tax=Cryptosporangium aurantiacum TaxID=134849 RepID=A0A1M7P8K9_9ACTN|nr:hypothetical protein [Cryptosporangium aurantiacum]SHN12991.1 hypothetical protein SAMN05443668_10356 [Cryptosporangium aurantiacum]